MRVTSFLWALACGALLTSCSTGNSHSKQEAAKSVNRAVAVLAPMDGSKVVGLITFLRQEGGVRVIADIDGLTPGQHGFHIHEFGVCTLPDAASAGGHFNPKSKHHGGPDAAQRHAGDLGNLVADDLGHAHYDRVDKVITLDGKDTIVGRSVIVHEKVDDYTTQPTGDAGGRLACGIIEEAD